MRKYAYAWLTLGFFLVSFGLHWFFGWKAFQDEARAHHEAVELNQYLVQMGRDTFENWQSEFLQLLWQVVGLAYFLYLGSPTSHENDDRLEAKVDALLHFHGKKGKEIIVQLDKHFVRHPRDPEPTVEKDELDKLLNGEKADLV
jgi:cbb3-type cytochrome oxidase subunit 3